MRYRTGPPSGSRGRAAAGVYRSADAPKCLQSERHGALQGRFDRPAQFSPVRPGALRPLSNSPRTAYARRKQLGHEVDQALQRQADDVEIVALDTRDQDRPGALDGVAAGAPAPLRGAHVPVQQRGARVAEVDRGDLGRGVGELAVTDNGDRPDDLMAATGQARDVGARLGLVGGLAEDVAADGHQRVGAERERLRHGQRLAARVLLGDGDRVAVGLLLDARDADVERDADLLEDRAPLRRRRRERQPSSGKNSPASRMPDSGASDPWTMLVPPSIAKSPRIEPGTASSGLVAPIT